MHKPKCTNHCPPYPCVVLGCNWLSATKDDMLAMMGPAHLAIDQTVQQETNECGPCLLLTVTGQVCGWFERQPLENGRRTALAVALFTADVGAVLGLMDATVFKNHACKLKALLADKNTMDNDIVCNLLPLADAARVPRMGSNTIRAVDMKETLRNGSTIKGSSLSCLSLPFLVFLPSLPCLALPCLALPCLALPCLALPCFALLCLALPCLALPYLTLPCAALPCPALPCRALSCLAFNDFLTSLHAH
jgi:hypothetical protein